MSYDVNEQLGEMQGILLDMLKFFKKFCEENNLTFFLAYGTCIGAIRHKGFIPWDDDIDILMPPDDYDRLLKLWPNLTSKGKYTLCNTDENYCDRHLALTIRDDETTYIRDADVDLDTNHGMMIEIGRYEYVAASKLGNYMQMFHTCVYMIYRTQRKPNNGSKYVKMLASLMLALVPSYKMRCKIWRFAEKQVFKIPKRKSGYIRFLGSMRALKKYVNEKAFSRAVMVPYEDTEMPVPVGYDSYLKKFYGDYMTPPPEKDRVFHPVLFVDTKNGYKKYRGKKYFVKHNK